MPGVPSGRGCEACRKQKKKCDQLKPSCSRCMRLHISCIGNGQRRYKFHQQMVVVHPTKSQSRDTAIVTVTEIPRSPSNEATAVASALVSALEVTDLRFDITYFGEFLKGIPSRLGKNRALDASVSALTLAYRSFCARRTSLETIDAYVEALKSLRMCLNKPCKAQATNNLCAMYLIIICQAWLGKRDDRSISHGEAITCLMEEADAQDLQGDFGKELLASLYVTMISESFNNPKIQLDLFLTHFTEIYGPPLPDQTLTLPKLAKIPAFLSNPEAHLLEIQQLYDDFVVELPKLGGRLAALVDPVSGYVHPNTSPDIRKAHARGQALYGFLLGFAILLNALLRAFDPFNMILEEEIALYTTEILALGVHASVYRPLSAGYVPLCLIAAWAATTDSFKRRDLEIMLDEYQTDFVDARWMEMGIWLSMKLEQLNSRLAASLLGEPLDTLCINWDRGSIGAKEVEDGKISCCVM